MKHLNTYITEYIVKKKLDKPIDSEHNYKYFPKTKEELVANIKKLLSKGETDLNSIDTNSITDMSHLFKELNIPINIDISDWDVSNVENMEGMFYNYDIFNCDLSKWNVSKVKNMSCMFLNCKNFDCDLSNWDVSNVTNMAYMFANCPKFEGKVLKKWDVSKVKDMTVMFYNVKSKPSWYKE